MATTTTLPTEVELVFDVMPCNALRTSQEPGAEPHACTYFREWGTYHGYDYDMEGSPPKRGIVQDMHYVGRAPLVPELMSGCRKAPIVALGINPNLPGWWARTRRSLMPLLGDYRQYAHYFRYRAIDKLALSAADYASYGGGPDDTPLSTFELNVPADANGVRTIHAELQPQTMYEGYEGLLDAMAKRMGWANHKLSVGEDLAYANMVACPSAMWITSANDRDPSAPPMTIPQRNGIVTECFRHRRHFIRQLFQSLPSVLLIFSQETARAFNGEMVGRFIGEAPAPSASLATLMNMNVRVHYGDLDDGTSLECRVIYSPHISGNPAEFAKRRERVIAQLVEEAAAGSLRFEAATGHLTRSRGACVFCPFLEIGPCDYAEELTPLSNQPRFTAASASPAAHLQEKERQEALSAGLDAAWQPVSVTWGDVDNSEEMLDAEL
jgi:hypothetical protein